MTAAISGLTDPHLEDDEIGWTDEELDMIPEEIRYEIEDGILTVSPRPALWHQKFEARLITLLDAQCPEEWTSVPEAEIRIYEHGKITQSRSPDLMLVPTKITTTEADRNWVHPHEIALALEIVSPSSRIGDRITKSALYAEWKIPFYLRIESKPTVALFEYRLDAETGHYQSPVQHTNIFETDTPFPLQIDLAMLR